MAPLEVFKDEQGLHTLTTRRDIPSLTGLRGVAACMVVLYHYFQHVPLGLAHGPIAHSYIAVDLFFVLSGFVMALTYGRMFTQAVSVKTYAHFLAKRLGRVYPLYAVVTLALAVLVWLHVIDAKPPSAFVVIANTLMIQAWGFADSIGGTTWSISTEFAAYLAFPAIVPLMLGKRMLWAWVAAGCALAALACLSQLGSVTLNQIVDGIPNRSGPLDIYRPGTVFPLVRCLAGFILGVATFRVSIIAAMRGYAGWRHAGDVAALVVAILWMKYGTDVALVAAFALLVLTLASGRSWAGRFLQGAAVVWLGEVSYSIYLIHGPIGLLLRARMVAVLGANHVPHAYAAAGIPLLLATLLASAGTFYAIEKPARDWSRKLMSRRVAPNAAASAPP